MNVLVLNAGSSTLKFRVIRTDEERIKNDGDERLASGVVDRIGGEALITFQAEGQAPERSARPVRLHAWVIPTDEELLIARDTVRLILGMDTRF